MNENTEYMAEAARAAGMPDGFEDVPAGPAPGAARGNEEMERLKAEAEKNLAGWQRERAEFQNAKRRHEAQLADAWANAQADLAGRLLPALDDLDLAMANAPEEVRGNPWYGGLQGVYRKIQHEFQAAGVTEIAAEGQPFDPQLHEAVSTVPGPRDVVVQVYRKGYAFRDRTLRPAMVTVGDGSPPGTPEPAS